MNRNIVLLVGFVLLFVAIMYAVVTYNRQLTLKAFNECAAISKYEQRQQNGTVISYPLPDFFNPCIERVNGK